MYIEENYNSAIVALSVIIAVFASYSALTIAGKVSHTKGRIRYFWLLAGSIVMGVGVWSMHFVGMLAFHLNMEVKYDTFLTILSLSASMISSFIAFYITKERNINMRRILIGGLFMGGGIVTMHYVGMAAMIMPVDMSYDEFYVVLSVIIAFVTSYVALFLFIRFRDQTSASWLKWLSASVMGMAVCGMHYTGMKAAKFHDHAGMATEGTYVDFFLLYGVTAAIFTILMVSWAAVFFDRNVLERLAYLDTITRLPNRNEMNRFFDSHRGNENIGVLFIDLDHFKVVNGTLGHNTGDLLIEEVGNRLREFIRHDQQAFRIGGDEFLFIVKNCGQEQAENLAEQILKSIKTAYFIEGNELYVTASIGISIGSIKDDNRSMLLKAADTAMYKAKDLGKNQYFVYNEQMGTKEVRKLELEKDLLRVLEANQLYLVYQPKWNVKTNSLVGFEALSRWVHPRLGLISPAEFIPIAEMTGFIVPMTKWTLKVACLQCKAWQREGNTQPISVNISARLFQTGNLLEFVQEVLDEVKLAPELLELEITESMVFHDIEDTIRQLENIRKIGVKISMDDFGTGYSSIGLLDRLPLDSLKLDRLFTNDLETESKEAIISAVLLMAEKLNLEVIAEGVENETQIESLARLGCKVMQGYFYGKPMKSEEIERWMHPSYVEN